MRRFKQWLKGSLILLKEKIKTGQLLVKLTVVIPDALCKHVAYLEGITASRGEAEWLFVTLPSR